MRFVGLRHGQSTYNLQRLCNDDPLHARVGDGESLLDHFQRVSACLDRLAAQGADWPLLVAHEETLRVFKAWAEGLSLEQVVGLPFDNALPYAFESED